MIVEFYFRTFRGKRWFFYRVKALNGQIMMTSHEYSNYRKCVEGFRTVQLGFGIDDENIKFRWEKALANL